MNGAAWLADVSVMAVMWAVLETISITAFAIADLCEWVSSEFGKDDGMGVLNRMRRFVRAAIFQAAKAWAFRDQVIQDGKCAD